MSETLLAASTRDPRLGQVVQDRYRIVRKIGEGGMGAVYEGEHTVIKRKVAIKCLHAQYATNQEMVNRFQREAMAANTVRHPNIVEVTDMGRFDDGAVFMVLEFLEGSELSGLLKKEGALPLSRVVRIIGQACDALAAAHEHNIVHRDLKPDNIFICSDGTVKVVDFGIAKAFAGEERRHLVSEPSLTEAHRVVGTPVYMSPEVITKEGLSPASDLYSLGVILYEAMAGEPPFFEKDAIGTMYRHLHETPKRLREVDPTLEIPGALETLVRDLLAKRPEDRPPSAAEVVRRIDALMRVMSERRVEPAGPTGELTAVWDPIPRQEPEPAGRSKLPLLIVAAVLALMLGFGATAAAIWLFGGAETSRVRLPEESAATDGSP